WGGAGAHGGPGEGEGGVRGRVIAASQPRDPGCSAAPETADLSGIGPVGAFGHSRCGASTSVPHRSQKTVPTALTPPRPGQRPPPAEGGTRSPRRRPPGGSCG